MSTINLVAHGLTAGQRVAFESVVPAAPATGIDEDFVYYVLTAGLTADAFQISETDEGTPLTLLTNVISANMKVVPETDDTDPSIPAYVDITDPADVMAPPASLPAPSDPPVLTSTTVSDIVRLFIEIPGYPDGNQRLRATEVEVTHNFDAGVPQWVAPLTVTIPSGSSTISIPALGSTLYAARSRVQDVYGNYSLDWSPVSQLTTDAGSDSLIVPDSSITGPKIAPLSIETTHIKTNAIEARNLAATIILGSLIKTGDDGTQRVEMDQYGIRLMDAGNNLIVNIPTDPLLPVYIRGDLTTGNLVSQTAAQFRGTVSLDGSAVMTAQNGIATPTNPPTLATSVDYTTISSTPSGIGTAAGITYDAGSSAFWIAADPTAAGNYVAHEIVFGAVVRSITATGSTTTTTTTLGSTSHVSDTAAATSGSSDDQVSTPLTMPRDGRITKVSWYATGYGGTCTVKGAVWSSGGGTLHRSTGSVLLPSESFGTGNSNHNNEDLTSPLTVTSGTTYRVGWYRSSTDGFQWDRDDGAGKTTYIGDGGAGAYSGGSTDTSHKPNVYITYEYDTDTRLETAPNIGIASDGTYIYTLDTNGVVWKYNRTTLAHVAHSSVQTGITGTKSKAGMFYDSTAAELIITTTTGTGAGVRIKFVRVNTTTLAVSTAFYTDAAGPTYSGTTDTFRGGARVADSLNAGAATYWVPISGTVNAWTFSGTAATNTANRTFGTAATVDRGLTYDGSKMRGYSSTSTTKVWKFSNWDFTTGSTTFWVGYAWYDANATGGLHETPMSPRSSVTIRRRERVGVTIPAIPTGGTDDPNQAKVFGLLNATDTGPGTFWWEQSIVAPATTQNIIAIAGAGSNDLTVTTFPSGTPGEIKSAATGWSLKGDGSVTIDKTKPIGGKPPTVQRITSGTAATYTIPTGCTHVIVEVLGGGGAGGGAALTAAGSGALGGTGGGGGYARKTLSRTEITAGTVLYTVGAGGSPGAAGATSGGTGGSTTFSGSGFASMTGAGGVGGGGNGSSTADRMIGSGDGGLGSGGEVNVAGQAGDTGIVYPAATRVASGNGGRSMLGAGASTVVPAVGTGGAAGTAAVANSGGGGTGGYTLANGTNRAGGAGGSGLIIVTEFYGA